MSKYAILSYLVLFQFVCYAQESTPDSAVISRIREEGLHHSQVRFIAGHITDISGPRLTNSPGFFRAGHWAVDALKQWGLTNAQLEPWGEFGYGWSVDKSYIALRSPYYEPIIGYAVPWRGSTNGMVTAPVLMLDKMDSSYLAGLADRVRGKIVLLKTADTVIKSAFSAYATRYTDKDLLAMKDEYMITAAQLQFFLPSIRRQLLIEKMLSREGAVAALNMSGGRDGTVPVDAFGGYRKNSQPAIPVLNISKEAYLKMERLLEAGLPVQAELDVKTSFHKDDTRGYNVLAEIPGTDPVLRNEVVMLGGHLDSWSGGTGATDNGAGCIVMMEAVRILKTLGLQPRRTIRIALWSGEEQGLLGSFNYVKNHFGDPADMQLKPEQEKISVYFNLDNGTGKIRGIFDQGNKEADAIFSQWFKDFQDLGAGTVSQHNTGATDHLSFDAVGIPGFQFIQDPIEYETRTHHTNMDTYDHLQFDDLSQAATIVAAFVYRAAMRADKFPRKPLPKPEKFLFADFMNIE
ncbi:MAG TPA: M20/M25/M40 family metallo-hydrolase [Puia sp.]|nr:M20/M25/M40 family metallo-hydrolase [Puia sp.]